MAFVGNPTTEHAKPYTQKVHVKDPATEPERRKESGKRQRLRPNVASLATYPLCLKSQVSSRLAITRQLDRILYEYSHRLTLHSTVTAPENPSLEQASRNGKRTATQKMFHVTPIVQM